MGIARSRRDRRDLSRFETVYEDPEYERLGTRRDKLTAGVITGGSSLETIGGLAATVLAIVGFSYLPFHMASIATIAIGVALLSQGLSIMARWRDALRKLDGAHLDRSELVGGISTEVFGGMVGIVLGVLALAGLVPLVLLPVAAMVFGGSMLLGGAAQPDLVYLAPERDPRVARITYDAIQASGGTMILVGIVATVLGILAVLNVGPILTLTLVALLGIGGALTFAGGALTARFVRRLT